MSKTLTAYYAHPWQSETIGVGRVVEKWLEINLPNVNIVNPFWFGDLTPQWIRNKKSVTIAQAIVMKDLQLIDNADFLIVFYPAANGTQEFYGGFGTPMEIFYARHCLNVPVYMLSPFDHPWLLALGVKLYKDIDDLIKAIKEDWLT